MPGGAELGAGLLMLLILLIYVAAGATVIYLILLFRRFVCAVERIAEQLASKQG